MKKIGGNLKTKIFAKLTGRQNLLKIFMDVAAWGKKYRGDFIAGWIAFLVPFLITLAINGPNDLVAKTSLCGLIFVTIILILSYDSIFSLLVRWWRKSKFDSPIKIGVLNGYLNANKIGKPPSRPFTDYDPTDWFNSLSSIKGFNRP